MSIPISPAIIINEKFDARPEIPDGYNVLCMGYTSEGVANEPFVFRNLSEFLAVFGEPDPSKEEQIYSFESAKRIIESGATLVFVKLPYGAGEGFDVGEEYTALLFPTLKDTESTTEIVGYKASTFISAAEFGSELSAIAPFSGDFIEGEFISVADYNIAVSACAASGSDCVVDFGDFTEVSGLTDTLGYVFGEPVRVELTQNEYEKIKCGNIDWSDEYQNFDNAVSAYDFQEFGKAGLIVLDSGRSKSLNGREGYYISVVDNTDGDPATDWDAIKGIQTNLVTDGAPIWSDVSEDTYEFDLTAPFTSPVPSVSQSLASLAEQSVNGSWSDREHINYLNVTLWRLRKDVANGSNLLVPSVVESHTGSVSKTEKVIADGGYEKNVFLSDVVDGDSNRLTVIINPNIAEDTYEDADGQKILNTRMWREGLGGIQTPFPPIGTFNGYSDDLYSVSRYTPKQVVNAGDIGNVPLKIRNALCTVDNPDRITLDLSIEAGLGTIWTTVKEDRDSWITGNQEDNSFTFDPHVPLDVVGDVGRAIPDGSETGNLRTHWREVYDQFKDFTEKTRVSNGGYHHLHIADPLRQTLVNGRDCKVYDSLTKCKNQGVFAEEVYHPLKNMSKGINNSLSTIDAQWYKSINVYSSGPVWIPSSPVTAALMASTPFPWEAAAGVKRGVIRNVVDIAIDPVLRDRDYLWKINHNAVFYDRGVDGFLRFADKTLLKNTDIQLKENSARRLLVWLEKNLQSALRPFLFEPNNLQTRVRFKNEIESYLNTLLNNGAIEDFVVSLSKNTLTVQQSGCLVADIAIKITGIVNQIKLNLNLARLNQNFQEIL